MAALPIPDVNPVLAEEPTGRIDPGIIRRQNQVGIASGLQALAEGVDAIATTAGKAAGEEDAANAFQRNADGSLEPVAGAGGASHFIMGNAGRAYQHAFLAGTLAAGQTSVNEQIQDLRNQHENDPPGFRIAVGKYADTIRDKYPGALGNAMFNHAVQVGSQHTISLMEDKRKSDIQTSYTNIATSLTDKKNELIGLARNTPGDNPDFIEKTPLYNQIKEQYASFLTNPELAKMAPNGVWTKERVDSELANFKEQAMNEWVVGNAKRVRDKDGIDAAVKWAEKATIGSTSSLPMNQREAAYHSAVAQIGTLTQEQKAQAAASQATVRAFNELYHKGTPPSDEQFQGAVTAARKAFDVEGVAQLQAAREAYHRIVKPVAGLPPQAALGAIQGQPAPGSPMLAAGSGSSQGRGLGAINISYKGPLDSAAPGHPSPNALFGYFKAKGASSNEALLLTSAAASESGLNPGVKHDGGIGYGLWGHNGGRLDAMRAQSRSFMPNWQQQADYALQELRSRPEHGAVNSARTAEDLANAQMAFEAPQGYQPGSPQTGHNYTGRLNTIRRFAGLSGEALASSDPGVVGRNSPIPFSAEELQRNPWLASAAVAQLTADNGRQTAYAKDQIELIGKSVDMGIAPPPERVATVIQMAEQHPELQESVTKMQAKVAAAPIAAQAAGMPDGGAAYIEGARQLAAQSPDLYHLSLAEALQSQIHGRAKELQDDPHAYGARPDVGWLKKKPAPFEAMAAPQSVGADNPAGALQTAIADRREAGFQIGGRMGVPPAEAMFTQNDVKSLSNMLQRVDGNGAAMILGGLDKNLQPEEMAALAGNKEFANAVGGLARSGDPGKVGAAYGFLDKQWRQNPEAFKKEFGGDMATKLAVWQDKISFMGPEQAAKELQRANDPSTQRAMDALRDQADKNIKDLTPADVRYKAFGAWMQTPAAAPTSDAAMSSVAMLDDYRSAYRDLFAEGGDATIAEKRAVERVQQKWGKSDINGGAVMAYPPERYYPVDIYGKHTYVANQLTDAIGEAAVKYQGAGVDPVKLRGAPRALVADPMTQQDIANRLPPSYRVIIQDDAGRWLPLESAPGKPLRFRADPKAHIDAQTERMMIERRQSAMR
jgi:hypothetical protein